MCVWVCVCVCVCKGVGGCTFSAPTLIIPALTLTIPRHRSPSLTHPQVLHKFQVDLPKKHGRGGQSALRFARLRMEKRHNYVRKVRSQLHAPSAHHLCAALFALCHCIAVAGWGTEEGEPRTTSQHTQSQCIL